MVKRAKKKGTLWHKVNTLLCNHGRSTAQFYSLHVTFGTQGLSPAFHSFDLFSSRYNILQNCHIPVAVCSSLVNLKGLLE